MLTVPGVVVWEKVPYAEANTARSGQVAVAREAREQALKQMRAAADLEASMDKHPVTPGAIIPAREMLVEMLAESGKKSEALAEVQAVLR